jgi:hypothetical protein
VPRRSEGHSDSESLRKVVGATGFASDPLRPSRKPDAITLTVGNSGKRYADYLETCRRKFIKPESRTATITAEAIHRATAAGHRASL